MVESIARDYKAHPALFGYGVRDEPPADLFGRIGEVCRLFRKLDPDHPPLMNLFPGYAKPEQLAMEDYRDYVRKFIEVVDPAVLMYDHYPFKTNRAIDTGWHRDLSLFRRESRRADIPFWIFIQCQGNVAQLVVHSSYGPPYAHFLEKGQALPVELYCLCVRLACLGAISQTRERIRRTPAIVSLSTDSECLFNTS